MPKENLSLTQTHTYNNNNTHIEPTKESNSWHCVL